MAALDLVLFNLITGFMLGSIYGLATMGLNIIFGIIRIVNIAHGSLIMIGAYLTYWLFTLLLISPLLSIPIGFFIGLILGFAMFYAIIRGLLGTPDLVSLVATFGLAIFIEETAKLVWSPTPRGYTWDIGSTTFMGFTMPLTRILSSVLGIGLAVALYIFLYRTKIGAAIRATAQDPEAASLCGIDRLRIYSLSVALAIAITVMSGALIAIFFPAGIEPYMGGPYTLRAFVIAVLGGLGSPIGAFLAGLIFGIAENFSYTILSMLPIANPFSMTRFIAFSLLLILLLIKPEGIFRR